MGARKTIIRLAEELIRKQGISDTEQITQYINKNYRWGASNYQTGSILGRSKKFVGIGLTKTYPHRERWGLNPELETEHGK